MTRANPKAENLVSFFQRIDSAPRITKLGPSPSLPRTPLSPSARLREAREATLGPNLKGCLGGKSRRTNTFDMSLPGEPQVLPYVLPPTQAKPRARGRSGEERARLDNGCGRGAENLGIAISEMMSKLALASLQKAIRNRKDPLGLGWAWAPGRC